MRKLEDRLVSSVLILDKAVTLGKYERYRPELEYYFLQVGLFNTLALAAKGGAPREYIRRVSNTAHERADLLANPYHRSLGLGRRLHQRFMWHAPWLYCRMRGAVVSIGPIRQLAKRLLRG